MDEGVSGDHEGGQSCWEDKSKLGHDDTAV